MKRPYGFWLVAAAACIVLSATLIPGCKKDPSTDAGESYFDSNPYESLPRDETLPPPLIMTPSTLAVTMTGDREVFTVTGGEEPMRWQVSNRAAGSIEVQPNTRQAIYTALQPKGNTVIARDNFGSAAIATVTGEDSVGLTILPAGPYELPANGDRIELFAHGGTRWYTWEIVFDQRGVFVEQTQDGSRIVYQRTDDGDQTLIATDSDGRYVQVAISQPAAVPLTVVAAPSSLASNGMISVVSAAGGTPPYFWTAQLPARGTVLATSGNSVPYQRLTALDNVVRVTDSTTPTAISAAVVITQP